MNVQQVNPKVAVLIQPENVRSVLSEDEMQKLTNIVDKLLQNNMQLQLAYFPVDEN
jgi:hypothetical protein